MSNDKIHPMDLKQVNNIYILMVKAPSKVIACKGVPISMELHRRAA